MANAWRSVWAFRATARPSGRWNTIPWQTVLTVQNVSLAFVPGLGE
ncbi:MAG TPA: hypothetical protein VK464_08150 [Symbiobacteriaceae bacterium]|nr:hypothetical protein [Symbiobacteriaceae bacterium]